MKHFMLILSLISCLTGSCQVSQSEKVKANYRDTAQFNDKIFVDSVQAIPLFQINHVCDSILDNIVNNCKNDSLINFKPFGYYFYSEKKGLNYLVYIKPMNLVIYENNPFYGCFSYSNTFFLCIGENPNDLLYETKDSVSFVYRKRIDINKSDSIQISFRTDRFSDLNTNPIIRSLYFNEINYKFILQICVNE